MLRKRISRKLAARQSRYLGLVSKVCMEELERRLMLTSAIPGPILPTAPTPLQGVVSIPTSMGPALFDSSFDFNDIYFHLNGNITKGNGAGETIAIVDADGDPTIVQDAKTFDNYWGLSNNDSTGQFFLTVQPLAPTVHTQEFPDGAATASLWTGETALDVEWAHAVAPGAHILLVVAPSQDPFDMLDADVFAAEQPGVVVVSNSFGYNYNSTNIEVTSFFNGEPDNYDGFFVTPTGHLDSDGLAGGIVFMASSGDRFGQFAFPSGSDNVVSVGGMNVVTDLNGQVEDIGPWDNGTLNEGSGGANDTNYTNPYHEPLVSLDADPLTGVWIYDGSADAELPSTGWTVIGGTSLASPAWAAYTAIIDQGLAIQGMPSLNSQQNDYGDESNFQFQVQVAGETGVTYNINNNTIIETLDGTVFDSLFPVGTVWPLYPNNGVQSNQPSFEPTGNSGEPAFNAVPDNQNTGFGLPVGTTFANYILDEDWQQALDLQNPLISNASQAATQADEENSLAQWGDLATSLSVNDPGNPVVDPAALGADFLHFINQPGTTPAGQVFSVQVEALNPNTSALDTSYNGPITITLGANAGTGLVGTTTVDAVNGIATFSGLSITPLGSYDIFATATGLVPTQTSDFTVGPAAGASLTVSQEPGVAWQFGTIPNIVVSVLDQFGNLDSTGEPSNVSVSIASGPPNAILSGQLTVETTNGVATFSGLSVNLPGSYTFKFTDGNLTATISAAATIVPIPIKEHFTLNGFGLSESALVQQQQRNALIFTIEGPPTKAQVAQAQQEGENAEVDALFGKAFVAAQTAVPASTFVAAQAAVPASTFSSGNAITADAASTSDTSSVLDAVGAGNSNLLDK